ncbi:zinc finger CCCH domain-containing protein 48-like protein [Tanacetum coccineum]
MDYDRGKRVFNRLGPSSDNRNHNNHNNNNNNSNNQKVCYHWRAGNCTRPNCTFLHHEISLNNGTGASSKRPYNNGFATEDHRVSNVRRGGSSYVSGSNTWGRPGRGAGNGSGSGSSRVVVKNDRVCKYWVNGTCSFGDQCKFLHSWCTGSCFAMLTQLEGHQKVVSGIALPVGSDKLYTGSKDETVRVWDCQSGQCAGVINLGGEVGCMLNEGPWMFVGLPNLVKAWNVQTSAELSLNGPVGQVYSLAVGNELLFAGVQDSNILAWKYNTVTNCFEPVTALQGHSAAVVTLVVGANRLYSGSMDNSIRVWNLENLQCLQTLTGHTSVVMSVLCWDQFLLSCSLDKTIKVWAATDSGNLEATYTHMYLPCALETDAYRLL